MSAPEAERDGRPLARTLASTLTALRRARASPRPRLDAREIGVVASVGRGVVRVRGLSSATSDEVLALPRGVRAWVFDLGREEIGAVLLAPEAQVEAGDEVRGTGRTLEVPVGEELLGRVVDPLGRPLDGRGALRYTRSTPVEREAPPIMARAPVRTPLQTGLKVVDALVPVGRGQRQLIVGDRQTGKTAVAVDAIVNQRGRGVICVYCAIGQRNASVARVLDELDRAGARGHTVVVVAAGDAAPGVRFAAPYAATAMAEYFMERGRDVLVVFDDLTRHARAYRELCLLLRRPPGREGYPGDVFHVHARLLERATCLRDTHGGGSLTALPIVETQEGNISAYIPTNLVSITDGQIFLSPQLFQKGVLPAVDVGRSVSRVGGAAQLPAYRAVVGDLRLTHAQFQELEIFSRFAAQLDEATKGVLERGRRVREVLKQSEVSPLEVPEQIATLLAATEGVLDTTPVEEIAAAEGRIHHVVRETLPGLCRRILEGAPLGERDRTDLVEAARAAVGSRVEREP